MAKSFDHTTMNKDLKDKLTNFEEENPVIDLMEELP